MHVVCPTPTSKPSQPTFLLCTTPRKQYGLSFYFKYLTLKLRACLGIFRFKDALKQSLWGHAPFSAFTKYCCKTLGNHGSGVLTTTPIQFPTSP